MMKQKKTQTPRRATGMPPPKRGRRYDINKRESWLNTPSQRQRMSRIIDALHSDPQQRLPLSQIYLQVASNSAEREAVLVQIMFMWKLNLVGIRSNNGIKLVWLKKPKNRARAV